MSRSLTIRTVTAGLCALSLAGGPAATAEALPTAPALGKAASGQVTPADVVSYLKSLSGNHVVAGMHNKEPISTPTVYTDKVKNITGVYPGLWGSDFTFSDLGGRQAMIDEAQRQWRAGSLVTLTWHVCPPTMAEPCDWYKDIQSHLSDSQWNQLVTDGTSLNRAWKARLDTAVPYLQQLEDAGVPVLWRPLHELNDGWAWWGGHAGEGGSRKLYQITHDYLAKTKGLSNLAWIWAPKDVSTDLAGYYPGDDYVDVVGLDSWMSTYPSTSMYDAVASVAGSKPMVLAEVGKIPSPQQLASQPRWTYFMCWSEYLTDTSYNTTGSVKATYADSRILHQGQITVSAGPSSPSPGPSSPSPSSPGPGTGTVKNLALDRPAYASSTEGTGYPASAAFDGKADTRWSSTYADPQWLYVDLGSVRTVTGVTLKWETAYAKMYQIQTSTDGKTWTTVHHDYAADGGTDTISLPSARARYVKMYAWQRGTAWGYSLWDVAVSGS